MDYQAKYGCNYEIKLVSDIEGLELYPQYKVDTLGCVWRWDFTKRKWFIMKPSNLNGYKQVNLTTDGKRKGLLVHRLVALAFIPQVDGKEHVNHIDGNKANNVVSNLEWCTPMENIHHAATLGLMELGGGYKKSARGKRKLSLEQVQWLISEYKAGYAISALAKLLGVNDKVIYQILGRVSYTDYTQGLEWPELDGSQYRKVYVKPRKPSDWY